MTTNNTNTAARFLHMKGDDAIIGKALHSARNLLNLIEDGTPVGYAIRTLLEGDGFDFTSMRAEVTAALDLPLPEQAPAAPAAEAAPAAAVDAETVAAMIREQIAAHIAALDVGKIAREAMEDKIDNDVDLDDVAHDVIKDKIEDDLSIDADEVAREIVAEKVENDLSVDADEVAREILEDKIDDLDLDSVVSNALSGKSVTVTLK